MFEFTKSIVVEGKAYNAGDRVRQEEILPGCFASLTRLGQLVPAPEPPDPATVFAAAMESKPMVFDTSGQVLMDQQRARTPALSESLVGPPGEPPAPEPKPEPKPETKKKK